MKKFYLLNLVFLQLFFIITFSVPAQDRNAADLPYHYDFVDDNEFTTWTVVDNNNDGRVWVRKSLGIYGWGMCYQSNTTNIADDYVITKAFKMERGKFYRLKFDVRTTLATKNNKMKIFIGKGVNAASQSIELLYLDNIVNTVYETQTVSFSVEESGDYNLGFYCCSEKDKGFLYFNNVHVEEYALIDLMAASVTGSKWPVLNNKTIHNVNVKNNSRIPISGFEVQIIGGDEGVLGSVNISNTIGPESVLSVPIQWTPTVEGDMEIRGKVIALDDNSSANDVSDAFPVFVQPAGSADVFQVGNGTENGFDVPFKFNARTYIGQSIYLSDEINVAGGTIERIAWPYNFTSDKVKNRPVKVYLVETDLNSLAGGAIAKEEFTLVFDGTVSAVKGEADLEISLDIPFEYYGRNLCILTELPYQQEYYSSYGMFYAFRDIVHEYRSRSWDNFSQVVPDFEQINLKTSFVPNVKFAIRTTGAGIVEGVVKDIDDNPIKDYLVSIPGLNIKRFTDEFGYYRFMYVTPGEYDIEGYKFGYIDEAKAGNSITEDNVCRVDFQVEKLPQYIVKGKINDEDGNSLSGVLVTVVGYDSYMMLSDDNGVFEFPGVYRFDGYEIKFSKDGLIDKKESFDVKNSVVDLGIVVMEDKLLAPLNVLIQQKEGNMLVSWIDPSDVMLFRYDSDVMESALGWDNGVGLGVFGTIYRTPAILFDMSWYLTSNNGMFNHTKVNVFVFDLDSEGNPTSKVIFSMKNVSTFDDKWSSYTFPKAVYAPNGFMIAVSCDDMYLAIAYDKRGNPEYPFATNSNCFSKDYTTGNFTYLDERMDNNFLLRANGVLMDASSSIVIDGTRFKRGYKVFRFSEGLENESDKWVTLNENPVTEESYSDNGWENLVQGTYRYAVKAIYAGNKLSEPQLSDVVGKDMLTNITVVVNTNTVNNEAVDKAVVTMVNNDGIREHVYVRTVNSIGEVVFENVWKGIYSLKIELNGFNAVSKLDLDFSQNNSYSTEEFVLEEITVKPSNLLIVNTEIESDKIFRWNVSNEIEDDFERHEDFSINSSGVIGWQYIDGDNIKTSGFNTCTYPNQFVPKAYMVFNYKSTVPSMDGNDKYSAHSGDKYLACFSVNPSPNKDYIISPELNFTEDFILSFWAKSWTSVYGLEKVKIGYSKNGCSENDFTWLTEESVEIAAGEWSLYKYAVPSDAKFVTIKCVSEDAFVLMIDDIFIGTEDVREFITYEVYLDYVKVGATHDKVYKFTDLKEGKHQAGVKSIYSSGETGLAVIEFEVNKQIQYAVNILQSEHGTVSVKNGDVLVNNGDMVNVNTVLTIEAVPDYEYKLDVIKVNGINITGSQTKITGNTTISATFSPLGIYENNSGSVKIYPNPVKGRVVNIDCGDVVPESAVLYSVTGSVLKVINDIDYLMKVDVTDVNEGVCFLKLIFGDKIETFKLVIEK